MSFVRTRCDADPLSFYFADPYWLIEEINGATGQMVQYDDIMSQKNTLRRRYAAMQYTKAEIGQAMKSRRFGF